MIVVTRESTSLYAIGVEASGGDGNEILSHRCNNQRCARLQFAGDHFLGRCRGFIPVAVFHYEQ